MLSRVFFWKSHFSPFSSSAVLHLSLSLISEEVGTTPTDYSIGSLSESGCMFWLRLEVSTCFPKFWGVECLEILFSLFIGKFPVLSVRRRTINTVFFVFFFFSFLFPVLFPAPKNLNLSLSLDSHLKNPKEFSKSGLKPHVMVPLIRALTTGLKLGSFSFIFLLLSFLISPASAIRRISSWQLCA